MAFISSAKHSSRNEDGNTACVPTSSTNVPTASANVTTISQDTACAYIASQSSGSQIKFEDINQIDEDDIEEMDIKWNMALLSMREDKFWKKTGKKISIQVSNMVGFDKSKVECFNCHKMGHFARERRALRNQDKGRRDYYRRGSKAEEQASKALMAIDGPIPVLKVRPSPTVESTSRDDQNKNPSVSETVASHITPKPFIKFVKPKDSQSKSKTVRPPYRAPWVPTVNRNLPPVNRKFSPGSKNFPTASRKFPTGSTKCSTADMGMKGKAATYPTSLILYHFDGGYVSFGQGGCKITRKGTIKSGKLKFENVYFVKDLKYNLFSVSQICDNKNSVLFTDSECIVLGRDFKLLNDANILLRTPRRLGHLNFKTMNKLVRHNLVRGLPTKCFENDHTCTACLKGKQHKVSCKSKLVNSVTKPLHTLHMDLFGLTSDETSGILKKFITEIENLKVKIIRCDNGGEFRNKEMNDFVHRKGSKESLAMLRLLSKMGLSNKSHNKTPYELFNCRSPAIEFLKPFGCHVMILNILDNLGKFEKKGDEGTKDAASQEVKKDVSSLRYIAFPNWTHDALLEFSSSKPQDHCSTEVPEGSGNPNLTASTSNPPADQIETLTVETPIPTVSSPVLTAYSIDSQEPSSDARLISKRIANQVKTPSLDNILSLTNRFKDILGVSSNSEESNKVEANISNMETAITDSPTPTLRIHKDHHKSQIIGPVDTPIQTRNKSKEVLKNKKDEKGIVIRNKARLVAQGYTQEKEIDYDEVFAPIARIEAIRLFLAYASFIGFTVYQIDVKSAFLYDTIDEEVYVMQPPGFQNPEFPAKVYKMEKAMYRLHQAPRAWYGTLSKYLLKNGFQRGTIDQTSFIIRQRGDFILVQVYVDDIIFRSINLQLCREFEALMHEKFQMSNMDELNFFLGLQVLQKEDGIFLSQDKPDIMFAVCAYARHQVTPKESYSDSDYGGATQDSKSNTGGCQFLGRRLISWQCKKQTIVATSTTEAEYVTAASCCSQVLWIQNQLLDYGLSMPCEALSREFSTSYFVSFLVCIQCAVTFGGLIIDARLNTAKTLDLVWMWLGGDYGNVFLMGFNWI
nr:putative ribonuclease H-like domain-containing protein [Tanacetum cinerariifolium]